MKLYLDQMFSTELAELLRARGYDVVRASDVGQARADDAAVLARAVEGERTVITLDKDFGDWVVLPLSEHPGVIRVRVHPTLTANVAAILVPFLAAHDQAEFRDHLIILSRTSERWINTGTQK